MSTTNCKFTVVKDESLKTIMDEIACQVEIINQREKKESERGCFTFPRWEFISSNYILEVEKWKYSYKDDSVIFIGRIWR